MAGRDITGAEEFYSQFGLTPLNPPLLINFIENLHSGWFENERCTDSEGVLTALAEENFTSAFTIFRELYQKDAVLCASVLGTIRRYRVLFPLHDGSNEYSTFKQRKNVRKNDPLLQHINTIISLLDDQHWIEEEHEGAEHYQLMGNLILRYERAMAERLDGDKAAALRLVDDLIQVLHLFPKDQRSIFTKRKSHFIHPLFTFNDPLVYVDFQHRLIRSSIGLPSIRNDEFSGIMDNILELKMEFEHAPRVSQLLAASQVRFFYHMDALFRRNFGETYLDKLEDQGKRAKVVKLFDMIEDQKTNRWLRELQRQRLPNSEHERREKYSTQWVKKHYQDRIRRGISMIDEYTKGHISNDYLATVAECLKEIGDLSKQNPYNQNSREFTNLNMFQRKHAQEARSGTSILPLKERNRLHHSMMVMSAGKPGSINFTNTIIDAVFFCSLRVEKIQSLTIEQSTGLLNQSNGFHATAIGKSTGHLRGLSFIPVCEYSQSNSEQLGQMDPSQKSKIDFLNFFYNSYFPTPAFSLTKKGFTKSMNINRMNALGKAITTLSTGIDGLTSEESRVKHSISKRGAVSGTTLAERYIFNILPKSWSNHENIATTMTYQIPFVILRLEELVELLLRTKASFINKQMPIAYRTRISVLLEKIAFVLGLEIQSTKIALEMIPREDEIERVKHMLEQYKHEVINHAGGLDDLKNSRHPIYGDLLGEIRKVMRLLDNTNLFDKKLSDMDDICASLCPVYRPHVEANEPMMSLVENRMELCKMLGDGGEYSGRKILTSNTLTARLIQQFVDSTKR